MKLSYPSIEAQPMNSEQLEIEAVQRVEMDLSDEIDEHPVKQSVVAAQGLAIPATKASRSVFEFIPQDRPKVQRKPVNWPLVNACYEGRVSVASEGVVKVTGAAYPSARWTPEREAKEKARRAKQTPPKPPKQTFRLRKEVD